MALQTNGVSADGLLAAAEALSSTSEDYGNDSRVEALWAMKAINHAEVYFNILCSVSPSQIPRLSSCDEEIITTFNECFPNFDVKNLDEVRDLKSEEMKAKWREFCEKFKHVEDYNFATLLRLDSSKDYEESNTVIATKIQFYAIEIARNRGGHNDSIKENYKPKPKVTKVVQGGEANGPQNTAQIENELMQILSGGHPMLR